MAALNKTERKKLCTEIVKILQSSLQDVDISYQDSMIKMIIQRTTFELNFGPFLWRLQQVIEESFPNRTTDISILIRDSGSRFEHVFKIWKS